MAVSTDNPAPKLPFPIFQISSKTERYMLYDIDTITWLRRTHHILGVLVGTLPQAPQQNIFLGLPLELMSEEAHLLVENDLAYIVNDRERYDRGITVGKRKAFMQDLAKEGRKAGEASQKKRMESTEKAMRKLRLSSTPARDSSPELLFDYPGNDESLFTNSSEPSSKSTSQPVVPSPDIWAITPTTSDPPFSDLGDFTIAQLPKVQAAPYALFKHLHAHEYFLSPGLRFGCQYMAYPGDPLRFHSHFLVVGAEWDEDLDLMDIVGGGRLSTGVKKGYMIGGTQPAEPGDEESSGTENVRAFSIEWAGM